MTIYAFGKRHQLPIGDVLTSDIFWFWTTASKKLTPDLEKNTSNICTVNIPDHLLRVHITGGVKLYTQTRYMCTCSVGLCNGNRHYSFTIWATIWNLLLSSSTWYHSIRQLETCVTLSNSANNPFFSFFLIQFNSHWNGYFGQIHLWQNPFCLV